MDWFGLFLRLDGRIGRKAFWVGFLIVVLLLAASDMLARGVGAAMVLFLVLFYPLIAVLVKRLHDRGRSGWWAVTVAAPLGVAFLTGVVARIAGFGASAIERSATLAIWVSVIAIVALVVIELGLRRGDPGYTEHGPPPLA